MTSEEWLKAYYPTAAATCGSGDEAVAHSLRKWEGIAWAIANRIGVPIPIDAGTCALCHHYYDAESPSNSCHACPLAKSLGHACDATEDEYGEELDRCSSPWFAYQDYKDPQPMRKALKGIPPC